MKYLLALLFSMTALAAPVEVELKKFNTFIPKGFDSNDSTEIVVTGLLPNHCYQSPRVEVKGENLNEVRVRVFANFVDVDECVQVQIPYMLTVPLGILDSGNYKIKSYNTEKILFIEQARTISIDDKIYANVDYIEENDYNRVVTLHGYNPSDCFELDEIKYTDNGFDTISVLPVLKVVKQDCPEVLVPFEYKFEVPRHLDSKVILLHARKMNGKSINKLFRNKLKK
jgi:hypothetical protein